MDNFIKYYEELVEDLKPISPAKIKAIRKSYNLSQAAFAQILRINVRTLQNYEIGHRTPCSTANALLKIAEENPDIFLKRLNSNYREFMR